MTHAFFLPCNCSENAETKRFFISKDEYSYDSLKNICHKSDAYKYAHEIY